MNKLRNPKIFAVVALLNFTTNPASAIETSSGPQLLISRGGLQRTMEASLEITSKSNESMPVRGILSSIAPMAISGQRIGHFSREWLINAGTKRAPSSLRQVSSPDTLLKITAKDIFKSALGVAVGAGAGAVLGAGLWMHVDRRNKWGLNELGFRFDRYTRFGAAIGAVSGLIVATYLFHKKQQGL